MGRVALLVCLLVLAALASGCQGVAPPTANPSALPTETTSAPAAAQPLDPTPLPATPAATPASAAVAPAPASQGPRTLTFRNRPSLPDLDLYDIAARLRPGADLARPARPPRRRVGEVESFWAFDLEATTPFRVSAVLQEATAHADFYLQEGLAMPGQRIREAARLFEEVVYPTVTGAFGPLGQEPLTLLHLALPAVAGYYDSGSEYPPGVSLYTNGRPMLFLNTASTLPGSTAYASLLAHELQHAVHWVADPTEEVWINEGLSVLASSLVASDEALIQAFLTEPLTQLTAWPAPPAAAAPQYGAAGLLMEFLQARYPGRDGTLRALVARPEDGLDGLSAYLAEQGYRIGWRELLAEWTTANYLDGRSSWDRYPKREVALSPAHALAEPGAASAQAPQFAAYYASLALPPGDYRLSFQGEARTPLLPTEERAGFWWSGSEDAVDATLAHAFDLRGVSAATLALRLWYDIEEDWDYAYLTVSRDKGRTWEILETSHTSPENPVGQGFGPGYTGRSGGRLGPTWIEERVDLSAYAGQEVLVRLEYVTDGAVSLDGIALARAAVPEIGYAWEGEGDGGWETQGFFLSDGWAQQEYEVRLLLVRRDGTAEVLPVPLDSSQRGAVLLHGLGADYRQAALLVLPLAPATRQPAAFSYEMQAVEMQAVGLGSSKVPPAQPLDGMMAPPSS